MHLASLRHPTPRLACKRNGVHEKTAPSSSQMFATQETVDFEACVISRPACGRWRRPFKAPIQGRPTLAPHAPPCFRGLI